MELSDANSKSQGFIAYDDFSELRMDKNTNSSLFMLCLDNKIIEAKEKSVDLIFPEKLFVDIFNINEKSCLVYITKFFYHLIKYFPSNIEILFKKYDMERYLLSTFDDRDLCHSTNYVIKTVTSVVKDEKHKNLFSSDFVHSLCGIILELNDINLYANEFTLLSELVNNNYRIDVSSFIILASNILISNFDYKDKVSASCIKFMASSLKIVKELDESFYSVRIFINKCIRNEYYKKIIMDEYKIYVENILKYFIHDKNFIDESFLEQLTLFYVNRYYNFFSEIFVIIKTYPSETYIDFLTNNIKIFENNGIHYSLIIIFLLLNCEINKIIYLINKETILMLLDFCNISDPLDFDMYIKGVCNLINYYIKTNPNLLFDIVPKDQLLDMLLDLAMDKPAETILQDVIQLLQSSYDTY